MSLVWAQPPSVWSVLSLRQGMRAVTKAQGLLVPALVLWSGCWALYPRPNDGSVCWFESALLGSGPLPGFLRLFFSVPLPLGPGFVFFGV